MTTRTHPPRPELPVLTSLRFFAAAMVVVFHGGQSTLNPNWVGDFFMNGYEAVSFFFVLSGFILTYVYAPVPDAKVPRKRFWLARFARIYPLYFFSLAMALPPLLYSVVVSHLTPAPRFVAAALTAPLMLQSWVPAAAGVWNLPAWSISVEALFYLLFPFLVHWTRRMETRRFVVLAVGLVVIAGLLRAKFLAFEDLRNDLVLRNFSSYFPLLHLPQFVIGIAAARVFLDVPHLGGLFGEGLFGVASVAVCAIFFRRTHLSHYVTSDAVLAPLFAVAIYAGAFARGPVSALLSQAWLVWLGEASYALYILHYPLGFWWADLTHRFLRASTEDGATFWLYALTTLGLSAAAHLLIEKPGRRWLLRRYQLTAQEPTPPEDMGVIHPAAPAYPGNTNTER